MSDVILVVLCGSEAAGGLLAAAGRLAALAGSARIRALVVRAPLHAGPLAAEVLESEADALTAARERDRQRAAALRAAFAAWAAGWAGAATLAETDGSALAAVAEQGSRADMLVVARPAEADDAPTRQAFRGALLGTDRPVLVVPPGAGRFGRCVALAWRDDKRAIGAVIPALRCLARAEQVHVLAGVRPGAPAPNLPPVFAEHRISAVLHVLHLGGGPFGQALLAQATSLGADLLVMGAYAHSPLREALFGGVTRYVLAHADIPVLMRH